MLRVEFPDVQGQLSPGRIFALIPQREWAMQAWLTGSGRTAPRTPYLVDYNDLPGCLQEISSCTIELYFCRSKTAPRTGCCLLTERHARKGQLFHGPPSRACLRRVQMAARPSRLCALLSSRSQRAALLFETLLLLKMSRSTKTCPLHASLKRVGDVMSLL